MEGESIWEIPIPSAQFCYEPKAALKTKIYLKGKRKDLEFKASVYGTNPFPHRQDLQCSFFSEKKGKKGLVIYTCSKNFKDSVFSATGGIIIPK